MKLQALTKILQSTKKILIFTHDHPDPDCIASAIILEDIAKHFRITSRIVYGGKISRVENQTMIKLLKPKLYPYQKGEEKQYDLTAIVDTQKEMGNNSFPKQIIPDLTFDHHESVDPPQKFYDIRSDWGAAASILMDYYQQFYTVPSERVATAYCYALSTETKDLGQGATPLEVKCYKKTHPYCNPRHISMIRHSKKPHLFIKVLEMAIKNYKMKDNIFYCYLGEVNNAECVAEIADLFMSIEKVYFVLVVATYEGKGVASARTSIYGTHLGRIMHKVFIGSGKAGGHEMVAAGQFTGSPRKIIKNFLHEVKPFTILQQNKASSKAPSNRLS